MDTPDIILVGLIILAALFVIALVILRLRGTKTISPEQAAELTAGAEGVEYQWEARSQSWFAILTLFLVLAGVIALVLYGIGFDWRELMDRIPQVAIALIFAVLSMITQSLKANVFQLTRLGLIRFDKQKPANRQILFTWDSLAWFRPDDHGFRYYLDAQKVKPVEGLSLSFTGNGHVPCGKHAMLVNSLIMARGVPTSPAEPS